MKISLLLTLFPILGYTQNQDSLKLVLEVDSLIQESRKLTVKQDFEQALNLSVLAEKISEERFGKESAAYGSCCFNHGRILYLKGEFQEAEKWYLDSKFIRGRVLGKKSMDYAWCLYNLAVLYYETKDYEQSESLFIEAKLICEKTLGKKNLDYAKILKGLATLYLINTEFEKAEPFLLEVANIREFFLGNENPAYASTIYNLAIVYMFLNNDEKAEDLILKVKSINEKTIGKESLDYAHNLGMLAKINESRNDFDKAEDLFLEVMSIYEKIEGKESSDLANGMMNLAGLYKKMGDYNKSESMYLTVIDIFENKLKDKRHPIYSSCLTNLARLYILMEKYDKSLSFCIESLKIDEQSVGNNHRSYISGQSVLAEAYFHNNNLEKADSIYVEISKKNQSLLMKASLHLSERELNHYLETFSEEQSRLLSITYLTDSKKSIVSCYENELFYKGFLLNFNNQIRRMARIDSTSALKLKTLKIYQRRLADQYMLTLADQDSLIISELEEKANILEKDLTLAMSEYGEVKRQVHWQNISDALQSTDAAIEFVNYQYYNKKATDSTMYGALVTLPNSKAPLFIPLCEARQLDALIYKANGTRANYLQNLYASTQSDDLLSLNQLIWSPIEKVLGENGIKTVYFAPTGLLHRLNLGALAEGKSGARLADRYKLVPMGSTRLLAEGQTQTEAGHIPLNNALIYGGVRYEMDSSAITKANTQLGATAQDTTGGLFGFSNQTETQRGENWNYLPGTEKEARYLDGLLRRRNIHTTLRLGYEATEESFKQIGQNGPSPSLLHIGTHGFFFPDPQDSSRRRASLTGNEPVFKISEFSMIRSGLKLAGSRYAWENGHPLPGGHEDGILTAYEVSQMNLSNTQLVVLSACETGLGDIRGNEGVYGLQRAFRIAGAKNVLMSLWKVPDDATEKLMTHFYTHWLSEKKPLRESFEEAQKWLRGQKGFENPYFWAGFVLVGEL